VSKIDGLIAELAPAGIQFMTLGDLATTVSGLSGKTKSDFSGGSARYVTYKNVFANLVVDQRAPDFVNVQPGERQHRLHVGDVVFTGSSETTADVGMSSVVATEPTEPLYLNSFCFAVRFEDRDLLIPGFAKYLFRGDLVRTQIQRAASGVTRINVSKGRFMKIRVPVPPLEIQREIVKILDNFTELEAKLEAELEAELEARRHQFAFYRERLFTFHGEDAAHWSKMSEVGEFFRGRRFTKDDMVADGISSIHYGEIYTHFGTYAATPLSHVREELRPSLRFAKPGDLVIASVGETVEDVGKAVAWLGKEDVAIHDDCFGYRHSMNPKYVSYYFQTARFHAEKNKYVARAKVKRLSGESLGKLTIPVPSVDDQARIVSILDRFDALVNDLNVGLPAELAGRRSQYNHYRDRLLAFEEAL
jgi:type I restriction enzyme S subunit